MLTGTADINQLAADAPTIKAFLDQAVLFPEVYCLQVTLEMRKASREALLPPALHPTIPPALSIQAWQVLDGPWGAFDLVINRIYCRSGVRARGFTTRAFVSSAAVVEQLATGFGFPARLANIAFRQGYDGADLEVSIDGACALSLAAVDPEPMGPGDVQYTSTLNLAHTPKGLRLVQVEADHHADRVDRLQARLAHYDGGQFGNVLLQPGQVVSASLCHEQVELPPVRFVCKADELAFTGTEAI